MRFFLLEHIISIAFLLFSLWVFFISRCLSFSSCFDTDFIMVVLHFLQSKYALMYIEY